MFNRVSRWCVLGLTFTSFHLLAQPSTYTPQELHTLHQKEQAAFNAPITKPQQTLLSNILQLSTPYQAQAQAELEQGLQKMPPTHSAPLIHSSVMVFTSLALPKTMFNQLVTQANVLHVPLLIRGILKGGMRVTIKALSARLIQKENNYVMGGVSIDPRAFKQFGITQVPAFVAVKKGHCINNQEICDTNDFDVIYGSLSLNNALDILARKGRFGDEINKINALNKQENKRG